MKYILMGVLFLTATQVFAARKQVADSVVCTAYCGGFDLESHNLVGSDKALIQLGPDLETAFRNLQTACSSSITGAYLYVGFRLSAAKAESLELATVPNSCAKN